MNLEHITNVTKMHGGTQIVTKYDNGYGASIICHEGSYGFHQGLWELAVIEHNETGFSLVYNTSITSDVLGYLTEQNVKETCEKIMALPRRTT